MNSSSEFESIILFDSTSNIDDIKKYIDSKKFLIITFDYESHILLSNRKIKHQISDNYLEKNDFENIQNKSYLFAKWFAKEEFANIIKYQNINLGELFHVEFHYMLIPFLKKFIEVYKLSQKFTGSTFITQNLLYRISFFFNDNTLSFADPIENDGQNFLYDIININLKLKNFPISFTISKSKYFKLKNFSEKIILSFFKQPQKKFTHSALLVEFDPIKYDELLLKSKNFNMNLVLYSRRRPAIWNIKSFSIIKNSRINTSIFNPFDKNNVIKKEKINSLIDSKLNNLSNDHLKSFFTLSNFSFWDILKPHFFQICKTRMFEGIQEIEIAKNVFNNNKFSSILVLNENSFHELIIIHMAKERNIPIILLQHGLYHDSEESKQINQLLGIFPHYSDKFLGWGEIICKYLKKCNLSETKIFSLGSPLFDEIFSKKLKSNKSSDYILLTISGPEQIWIYDLTVKFRTNYENAIKVIYETVSKNGKKLIIKLHPSQNDICIQNFHTKFPKIKIVKGENIFPLIESCEILINFDLSSTLLIAQILEKPTISLDLNYTELGKSEIFKSNSTQFIKIENFEEIFNKIIQDDKFRQMIIENGNLFINHYFSNQGFATKEILSLIKRT